MLKWLLCFFLTSLLNIPCYSQIAVGSSEGVHDIPNTIHWRSALNSCLEQWPKQLTAGIIWHYNSSKNELTPARVISLQVGPNVTAIEFQLNVYSRLANILYDSLSIKSDTILANICRHLRYYADALNTIAAENIMESATQSAQALDCLLSANNILMAADSAVDKALTSVEHQRLKVLTHNNLLILNKAFTLANEGQIYAQGEAEAGRPAIDYCFKYRDMVEEIHDLRFVALKYIGEHSYLLPPNVRQKLKLLEGCGEYDSTEFDEKVDRALFVNAAISYVWPHTGEPTPGGQLFPLDRQLTTYFKKLGLKPRE